MADEQTTTTVDQAGISRAPDGTITDGQSSTTTTQETTTQTKTTDDNESRSLLNRQSSATETKSEKTESGETTGKKPPETGAPDKYSAYTLPDGYVLDPAIETKANTIFKSMNLSQSQAQQLVDFYRETTDAAFRQPFDAYQEIVNGWEEESKNHPELKGKIEPGQEINARIGRYLDSYPDKAVAQAFRDEMDLTGAGNHYAFILVLNHLIKQITEGSHVSGKGPTPAGQSAPGVAAPPSAAAAIWPSLPSGQRG